MEFDLPETITVATRVGDRLILERAVGAGKGFATVDFEYRRWQLGEHPHRILNYVDTSYRGRNWKKDLVRDAVEALLSAPSEKESGEGSMESAATAIAQATLKPARAVELVMDPLLIPPAEDPVRTVPEEATAFAWKRLQDGQISQEVIADSPESLFQLAGFRPHRVLDPVQGFRCIPVRWERGRWVENMEPLKN